MMDEQEYVRYLKGRGRSETTVTRYRGLVENFVTTCGRKKRYGRSDVLSYTAGLRERGCSNNYLRYVFYVLKDFFHFLETPWPLERKDLPPADEPEVPFFTEEQTFQILEYLESNGDIPLRVRCQMNLAADSAPRRIELRNLERKDIDFEKRQVFIRAKKHNLSGWRPLRDRTLELLKEYFDSRSDDSPVAFYSPDSGGQLSLGQLSTDFRNLMKRIFPDRDMRGYGYHCFRRGLTTMLDLRGLTTAQQKRAFGWKSDSMPLRYRHILSGQEVPDKVRSIHPLFREKDVRPCTGCGGSLKPTDGFLCESCKEILAREHRKKSPERK